MLDRNTILKLNKYQNHHKAIKMKKVMKMLMITLFSISSTIIGCDDDTGDGTVDIEEIVTVTKVADTGQVECASGPEGNDAMASCSEESVTVAGQDGSYEDIPNARSFVGPAAHDTFDSDYTTYDNVTGLVWMACTQGQELTDAICDGSAIGMTWEEGIDSCEALNSLNSGTGYAGISDWRLPTISELRTLVNYGESDPAVDARYFPDTASFWYWSFDEHRNPGNAFAVNFETGTVQWWAKRGGPYVRCVSSSTTTGTEDELVWTKCSMKTVSEDPKMDTSADCTGTPGRGTWQDALAACENLESTERTDWRLPSVAELHSLIDVDQTGKVFIDQDSFPDTPETEAYYWSSTTYTGLNDPNNQICTGITECAWYVNFNDGYVEGVKNRSQKDQQNYVRCVAGP